MPRYEVTTVQVIRQTVYFEVDAQDEEDAFNKVEQAAINPTDDVELVDSQDEEVLANVPQHIKMLESDEPPTTEDAA